MGKCSADAEQQFAVGRIRPAGAGRERLHLVHGQPQLGHVLEDLGLIEIGGLLRAGQLQSQGMKMDDYLKMIGGDVKGMRDSMRPMAEQTVRSNILLSEIVHQENLDVTEEEVEDELKKMAEQYKMELDKIREMVDVEAVKSDLKGRKAVKLIVDNAKPVEKEKKTAKKEEAAEAPADEAKTEE